MGVARPLPIRTGKNTRASKTAVRRLRERNGNHYSSTREDKEVSFTTQLGRLEVRTGA